MIGPYDPMPSVEPPFVRPERPFLNRRLNSTNAAARGNRPPDPMVVDHGRTLLLSFQLFGMAQHLGAIDTGAGGSPSPNGDRIRTRNAR